MKEITKAGLQMETVYFGKRNPIENERNIMATIDSEKLSGSLSFTRMHLFWRRLESMRRSILQLGKTLNTDHILEEVVALLDKDDDNGQGWAVMGSGHSMLRLEGARLMDCLNLFSVWGDKVGKLGLVGAVKYALEPTVEHRCQSSVLPFDEGLLDEKVVVVCNECKRPMEKFVLYKCEI